MQKMGWFGVVRGHSRSWAMPPFDRAHTTSYLTLIETMCLSFTIFEIQPVICRKSPILTNPTCIWHPQSNFAESLASENQSPWGIVWCSLCDPTFCHFSRTPTCDRRTRTDGRTQAHGQYRGCIASRGKNDCVKMGPLETTGLYFLFKKHMTIRLALAHRISRPRPYITVCTRCTY